MLCKILLALSLVGGCDGASEFTEHKTSPDADGMAAWIDDVAIPVRVVQLEAIAQGVATPDRPLQPDSPQFSQILDQLIDQHLLAQEAQKRGLDAGAEAQHRLLTARQRILGSLLLDAMTADHVNEAVLRKMYESQIELIQAGKEVRLRHILLRTRPEAEKIAALLDAGDDFTTLAAQESRDVETAQDGGDLGYIRVDETPIGMRQILRQLPVGQIGGPVHSEHGWHVLRIDDRRTEQAPSFEELRPRIAQFLTLRMIDRELNRLLRLARITRLDAVEKLPETPPTPTPATGAPQDDNAMTATTEEMKSNEAAPTPEAPAASDAEGAPSLRPDRQ